MKPTGKINPITGDEILKAEESDITFLDKEWNELSDNEKATFLSFLDVRFLSKEGCCKFSRNQNTFVEK